MWVRTARQYSIIIVSTWKIFFFPSDLNNLVLLCRIIWLYCRQDSTTFLKCFIHFQLLVRWTNDGGWRSYIVWLWVLFVDLLLNCIVLWLKFTSNHWHFWLDIILRLVEGCAGLPSLRLHSLTIDLRVTLTTDEIWCDARLIRLAIWSVIYRMHSIFWRWIRKMRLFIIIIIGFSMLLGIFDKRSWLVRWWCLVY